MPKVNQNYFEQKRNEILDAALAVSMRKPMYEVSMRDIIAESGLSQGGIYRYFSNIDEIFIALINRYCILFDVRQQVEKLLNTNNHPEKVIHELLLLWKHLVLNNIIGVGKIYFELCTVYANDKARLMNFISKSLISSEAMYLQEKSVLYVSQQIQEGYFMPKLPFDDIIKFLIASLDGITRDLILSSYDNSQEIFSFDPQFNKDRLVETLTIAFILLLGGNE